MSTIEEADALHWLVKNGHMEDPYEWSTWRLGNRRRLPRRSSISGKFMFNTKDVYYRRRKEEGVDAGGWPKWIWKYQYATKKEAFKAQLENK